LTDYLTIGGGIIDFGRTTSIIIQSIGSIEVSNGIGFRFANIIWKCDRSSIGIE